MTQLIYAISFSSTIAIGANYEGRGEENLDQSSPIEKK